YRLDPNATVSTLNMVDSGTGGDAIAGDGVYSATIPGQAAGTIVAFYLQATDNFAPAATTKFPDDAPTRECLIRWGETQPRSTFGAYRILTHKATANAWAAREKNSNKPLDCTFTYNNYRVIYNARTLYSGSPWHTPGYNGPLGNLCDYVLNTPEDDLML